MHKDIQKGNVNEPVDSQKLAAKTWTQQCNEQQRLPAPSNTTTVSKKNGTEEQFKIIYEILIISWRKYLYSDDSSVWLVNYVWYPNIFVSDL